MYLANKIAKPCWIQQQVIS